MKAIHLLCVGKLKERFYSDAADHYIKRLGRRFRLEVTEIKDAPGDLPEQARKEHEGERLLKVLPASAHIMALDERGTQHTSRRFASKIDDLLVDDRPPALIIGGPFGLSDQVKSASHELLGLGKLTLPYELARVVMLEQLYRAASILDNTPYHHD